MGLLSSDGFLGLGRKKRHSQGPGELPVKYCGFNIRHKYAIYYTLSSFRKGQNMFLKYSAFEFAAFPALWMLYAAYCLGMNAQMTTCQIHGGGQSIILNGIWLHWETRNIIHAIFNLLSLIGLEVNCFFSQQLYVFFHVLKPNAYLIQICCHWICTLGN